MEAIKIVGTGDVPMEGNGIKLGQDGNSENIGVDAVADGDIDQPIFSGNRDSGFGTQHGERVEALTLTTSQGVVVWSDLILLHLLYTKNPALINKNRQYGDF